MLVAVPGKTQKSRYLHNLRFFECGDGKGSRTEVKWLSLPLGLALGSPIFPSGCEGKLGVALESLQGLRDLT